MPRQKKALTRQDWIVDARKVFVASGIEDVKINRLARRLRVTRGSFYWHFKGREDLLDALLHDWEARNHLEIEQVRTLWRAERPDLVDVARVWLTEDPTFPTFGMAIRMWATKASAVAEAVRRVDDDWVELLRLFFQKEGYGDVESFARARGVYFHQIGYYALAIREDFEQRIRLAPYYHESLTGKPPGPKLFALLEELRATNKLTRGSSTTNRRQLRPKL